MKWKSPKGYSGQHSDSQPFAWSERDDSPQLGLQSVQRSRQVGTTASLLLGPWHLGE
jgi:hypothetical protein